MGDYHRLAASRKLSHTDLQVVVRDHDSSAATAQPTNDADHAPDPHEHDNGDSDADPDQQPASTQIGG